MANDNVTSYTTPEGVTHTTVVAGSGGGSAMGWVLGLVALILLAVGVYYVTGVSSSETAKNNAITAAAQDVGNAAQDVSVAAQDAAKQETAN